MKTWTITVDGQPYGGESDAVEAVPSPGVGLGWTGKAPASRNGITMGALAARIQGRSNLRSHLQRILNRVDPVELIIREVL